MMLGEVSGGGAADAAALPAQSELGAIRGGGRTYLITPEDALWLARAVKYEGGDYAATCWAYATRLIAWRYSGSLAELVRGHSSTVNPRWAEPGRDLCAAHPENCTPAQIANRAAARTRTWSELGTAAGAVLAFAQARTTNPAPRADDFASGDVAPRFLARHPRARAVLEVHGQTYIADEHAVDLPADYVTLAYQNRVAGPARSYVPLIIGASAALAAVTITGVVLSRRRSPTWRRAR